MRGWAAEFIELWGIDEFETILAFDDITLGYPHILISLLILPSTFWGVPKVLFIKNGDTVLGIKVGTWGGDGGKHPTVTGNYRACDSLRTPFNNTFLAIISGVFIIWGCDL